MRATTSVTTPTLVARSAGQLVILAAQLVTVYNDVAYTVKVVNGAEADEVRTPASVLVAKARVDVELASETGKAVNPDSAARVVLVRVRLARELKISELVVAFSA